MPPITIPFGDLKRQYDAIGDELSAAATRVLASGWYKLGAEVSAFEQEWAAYCGAEHAVGVANGADALYLALAALDIGPGDEVVTVANACMYEPAAVMQTGATPVLIDIDEATHNLNPALLEGAITPRTKAIMPVHLYGRLADMPAICATAARHGIPVVEDAAQAHGAWRPDAEGVQRRAGSWGAMACWSFYPSKNLGAVGDAGAVTTGDAALAERLRRLREYGWGSKYVVSEVGGRNSRLDELQAALLRVKLRHLDQWNAARRERAAWYRAGLAGSGLQLPADEPGHVYHLFVVASDERDTLRARLADAGVACDVHYPVPAHRQPAYAALHGVSLPHTERTAERILSLPMFPELTQDEVGRVCEALVATSLG